MITTVITTVLTVSKVLETSTLTETTPCSSGLVGTRETTTTWPTWNILVEDSFGTRVHRRWNIFDNSSFYYYEEIKRELNRILIYECRYTCHLQETDILPIIRRRPLRWKDPVFHWFVDEIVSSRIVVSCGVMIVVSLCDDWHLVSTVSMFLRFPTSHV